MKAIKRLFWLFAIIPIIGIGGIVLIPTKGMKYFSDFVDKPARIYNCIWQGLLKEGEEHGEKRIHPTQKPIKLFSDLIKDFSKENGCIIDLYAGGGTTMLASHQLNRKSLCMEMATDYCQVIIDRMRKLDPDIVIKKNGNVIH
jgi:DNA modification methylase